MYAKQLSAILFIYLWPTAISYAGCDDILKYINYNTQYNYSQLTTEQITTASLCSESYDKQSGSRSAQIEASYSAFHGGAQGSEQQIKEEQQKQCGGHYGKEYLNSIGIQQSQLVSQEAVDALKACYDSKQFQLTSLKFSPDDLSSFSSAFSWNGPRDITFNSVVVSADQSIKSIDFSTLTPLNLAINESDLDVKVTTPKIATCSIRYKDKTDITKPFSLSSGTNVSVTCDRIAHTTSDPVTHGSVKEYPGGLVTIITEAESIIIPLLRLSRAITPDDRLGQVESHLNTVSGQITTLSASDQLNSQQIQADTQDITSMKTRLAAVEHPYITMFWKHGNNGSVTCQTFCTDPKYGGGVGECLSAIVVVHDVYTCTIAPQGPVDCLCVTR
jgi:hypothetical protein